MKAACISGWLPTSDNNGLQAYGDLIRQFKPDWQVDVFHYDQSIDHPYDIYVGHSFGSSAARDAILKFSDYTVLYWGLIDPVDYHWDQKGNFIIPSNVLKADCFKRTEIDFFGIPPSSPIRNANQHYQNYDVTIGQGFLQAHKNAPRNPVIRKTIIDAIMSM